MASSALSGNINVDFLDLDTGRDYERLYFAPLITDVLFDIGEAFVGDYIYLFTGRYFPRSVVITAFAKMQIAWDANSYTSGGRGFALTLSVKKSSNGEYNFFLSMYNYGGCLGTHRTFSFVTNHFDGRR